LDLALFAESTAAFVAAVFVLGLLVGSFLNVVIHRLPIMFERQWRAECAELNGGEPAPAAERYDLIQPRSCCPQCRAPITAAQNIPVLSWLWLRGRCAGCGTRISRRYPLVELLTGSLSALVAWHFGCGFSAACGLVITWFLIAATFIDFDHQMLYDSLTLPLLWIGLLASLYSSHAWPHGPPVDTRSAVIGAAAGYFSLWAVYRVFKAITGKEGMGYGDFKLLAALGAALGWQMLLPIVLLSAAVGSVVGILLIALRRQDLSTRIPFGPYLAGAGYLAMLWGPEITSSYLGLYTH
jgi:leader peptidase (prepilin peptidase) / N-methyltransferase